MKITLRLRRSVLGGVLLCTTLPAVALASSVHKPAEMSCDEFLALDDVAKPKLVYWLEGFHHTGPSTGAFVDVENTERLIPQLVAECKKAPTVSMFTKVADLVAARTMAGSPPPASAPRPTKLSCEDFVALDDFVKPKVIYWAEGFTANGKPIDSVVDVDNTDKLVPVLVQECKQTPKASFWTALKKHV